MLCDELIESPVQTGQLLSHPPEMGSACVTLEGGRTPVVIIAWRILCETQRCWPVQVPGSNFTCSSFWQLLKVNINTKVTTRCRVELISPALIEASCLLSTCLALQVSLQAPIHPPATSQCFKNSLPTCLFFSSFRHLLPAPPLVTKQVPLQQLVLAYKYLLWLCFPDQALTNTAWITINNFWKMFSFFP